MQRDFRGLQRRLSDGTAATRRQRTLLLLLLLLVNLPPSHRTRPPQMRLGPTFAETIGAGVSLLTAVSCQIKHIEPHRGTERATGMALCCASRRVSCGGGDLRWGRGPALVEVPGTGLEGVVGQGPADGALGAMALGASPGRALSRRVEWPCGGGIVLVHLVYVARSITGLDDILRWRARAARRHALGEYRPNLKPKPARRLRSCSCF
ncbi:hypothetical protein BU16DRAFT_87399 [Lophium mytilinum]|uniref:Uncharacterized protein n=1 Tax=Lophium mytilinum TaxID=390894 RepID=A0A6A6QJX1_9PEZI|nr:hypothetical protein BU16DRAFT_87399 [Lophium mytilinum]